MNSITTNRLREFTARQQVARPNIYNDEPQASIPAERLSLHSGHFPGGMYDSPAAHLLSSRRVTESVSSSVVHLSAELGSPNGEDAKPASEAASMPEVESRLKSQCPLGFYWDEGGTKVAGKVTGNNPIHLGFYD